MGVACRPWSSSNRSENSTAGVEFQSNRYLYTNANHTTYIWEGKKPACVKCPRRRRRGANRIMKEKSDPSDVRLTWLWPFYQPWRKPDPVLPKEENEITSEAKQEGIRTTSSEHPAEQIGKDDYPFANQQRLQCSIGYTYPDWLTTNADWEMSHKLLPLIEWCCSSVGSGMGVNKMSAPASDSRNAVCLMREDLQSGEAEQKMVLQQGRRGLRRL